MTQDRREFLKKVGATAVTAPAAAVILSASAKTAGAGGVSSTISGLTRVPEDDIDNVPE